MIHETKLEPFGTVSAVKAANLLPEALSLLIEAMYHAKSNYTGVISEYLKRALTSSRGKETRCLNLCLSMLEMEGIADLIKEIQRPAPEAIWVAVYEDNIYFEPSSVLLGATIDKIRNKEVSYLDAPLTAKIEK